MTRHKWHGFLLQWQVFLRPCLKWLQRLPSQDSGPVENDRTEYWGFILTVLRMFNFLVASDFLSYEAPLYFVTSLRCQVLASRGRDLLQRGAELWAEESRLVERSCRLRLPTTTDKGGSNCHGHAPISLTAWFRFVFIYLFENTGQ